MKKSQDEARPVFEDLYPEDIGSDLAEVDEKIRESLKTDPSLIEKIGKHILDSGGKRLRPILHLLSARLCGQSGPVSINIATSTELLHTATLLHDDVIDSALTRRGKPSANVLWGNKSSILVGDYLFSQSVKLIVELDKASIMEAFSAVFRDLSLGEMLELINEHNLEIPLESYFEIIDKKTSSLFKLCMETGPLIDGKSPGLSGTLAKFGLDFGTAFQLIDDYLDYFGDTEKMGKPAMGDFKEKKVTFPLIHLLKICNEKERQGIKETFYQLKINGEEELFIKGLMDKYQVNMAILKMASDYNERAHEDLKGVKDSVYKRSLLAIMEFNLKRDR